MSNIILPRRRFLFMAPAVIAASSLMPGHSIGDLAFTKYDGVFVTEEIHHDGSPTPFPHKATGWLERPGEVVREISRREFEWNAAQMRCISAYHEGDVLGTRMAAIYRCNH